MWQIDPLPILQDNYVWRIRTSHGYWLVDPGPDPHWPARLQTAPEAILITHRHSDHVDGVPALLDAFGEIPVWGPASAPHVNRPLVEGAGPSVAGVACQVLATPGHTREHLSYYLPETRALFCGDTLFAGGCGRLLDGTAAELFQSLGRLAKLPDDTLIYCTHEYTRANLRFAKAVEPDNAALRERVAAATTTSVTLPSQLSLERATNPFLRCEQPAVRAAAESYAGRPLAKPVEVFAALRVWKNVY